MKLKRIFCLAMAAMVMLTGCVSADDEAELTGEERELNAVKLWFEKEIYDEDEFTDLIDYQYYARTIGLEKDGLLASDMWEIYYSDIVNINKEIDGAAIYLIRLNPDKLVEIWARNTDITADKIYSELGTSRDEFYHNFGYTANSIGYAKNHKDGKAAYPEKEERIFGADNGENRQTVFATHFLKVNIAGRYGVIYESTDELLEIKQRDLLKSITKPKTYNVSDFDAAEFEPAFYADNIGIKRLTVLNIPNGWTDAVDTDVTVMINMSPYSYGCTSEDIIDIITEENSETENVPPEHLESENENTDGNTDVPPEHLETVTEGSAE